LEIVTDSGEVAELAGRKRRVLAAVLAAQANRPVSVDVLAEALWGSAASRQTEASLRVHVHHLRRALGGTRIDRRPEGYVLALRPGELDIDRFRTALADGHEAALADDLERSGRLLGDALALWRGPALAALEGVPVLAAEVARPATPGAGPPRSPRSPRPSNTRPTAATRPTRSRVCAT
jgi:DNA-binding SARP family transcriptional activator